MPTYLRKDSIRLLEASAESLSLAIAGLGLPRRLILRDANVNNAAPIGLIGVSAELAMSSMLIQVNGPDALQLSNGHFKSGATILEEFRRLLRNPVPRLSFISKGIQNPTEHLTKIYEHTRRFKLLITLRASGLHTGNGPSFDVSLIAANDVISFLNELALSNRIKPYLPNIPQTPNIVRDRTLVVEDIARSIRETTNLNEQARLLSSVFLVLPEIPEEQPEWLNAFDRISISPREGDIAYLLNVLENAVPATLLRVNGGGEGLPVVVRNNDPNALPIAPQYLRREFTQIRDQWFADIGNANGRLTQGTLDLPPADFVLDAFVLRLNNLNVIQTGQFLTPHESWPFIVSSLSVNGTAGPFWFLVRATVDLNQLKAQILRVIEIGSGYLRNRRTEIIQGLDSIINNTPLSEITPFVQELLLAHESAESKKEHLNESIQRSKGSYRELSRDAEVVITEAYEGNISIGDVLIDIIENRVQIDDTRSKLYWIRILAESAYDEEDLPGLLAVLSTELYIPAHTAAKKAIRLVDFLSNGPSIEGN
ncbi:hypothetical protein [Cohnella cholangitidis]|uniref:Uncharacterized protein n=1 Tax=Cohnella cholangitidis TaxID=2598458 RepID=A0A7G5C698_9BACL|nr:hypothetical protein [Cohnella cholangitidis]QMV44732.1 hypothetical protein FPL14_28865 [Cohnella cholangitidis]